jgi:RNA polymerase sigma-70 factor (ECF subfamily)
MAADRTGRGVFEQTTTDAELLARSKRSAEAFEALYRRHAHDLYQWLLGQGVPVVEAADLLGELFAQAWVSRKRFRDPGDGNARPWLFGIGKNLLSSYRRKREVERRARHRLGVVHQTPSEADGIVDRIDAAALRGDLDGAMCALPLHQREAVALRVVDGLPYPVVAERLECTEQTARKRVSQGLQNLRTQLEE